MNANKKGTRRQMQGKLSRRCIEGVCLDEREGINRVRWGKMGICSFEDLSLYTPEMSEDVGELDREDQAEALDGRT